jgi:anti-sigma factor RsiW
MIHDRLPDLALDDAPVASEVEAHLRECAKCSETLEGLRATMNLLDEWKAPEPSAFWDVRMQARLREEQQRVVTRGWLEWFRRPALSVAAALCLVVGIGLYQAGRFMVASEEQLPSNSWMQPIPAPTGTAVADLEYLDQHRDMLQNFDALDILAGDDDADSSN